MDSSEKELYSYEWSEIACILFSRTVPEFALITGTWTTCLGEIFDAMFDTAVMGATDGLVNIDPTVGLVLIGVELFPVDIEMFPTLLFVLEPEIV